MTIDIARLKSPFISTLTPPDTHNQEEREEEVKTGGRQIKNTSLKQSVGNDSYVLTVWVSTLGSKCFILRTTTVPALAHLTALANTFKNRPCAKNFTVTTFI